MANVGYATLQIIPSVKGMSQALNSQMVGPAAAAGATAGKRAGGRFTKALKGPLGQAGAMFGGLFAVQSLVKFTKGTVDAASGIAEAANALNVVFGKQAQAQLQDWSKSAADSFGMSTLQAQQAATSFGAFAKAAGKTGKDAVSFSTGLTELAADMASLYNTEPEEAITALSAALRGESEPIRRYNVLLDDMTLRTRAVKLGIIDSTKQALTPQQRVLAAQAEIWAQTKDAQGDYDRTSNGLANTQRRVTAQFRDLQATLGKRLLPVANKAAHAIGAGLGGALDLLNGKASGNKLLDSLGKLGSGLMAQFGPVRDMIADNVLPALQAIGDVIVRDILPPLRRMIETMGDWLKEHPGLLKGLLIAVVAIRGPMLLVKGAVGGVSAVAKVGSKIVGHYKGVWAGFTGSLKTARAGISATKTALTKTGSAIKTGFTASVTGAKIAVNATKTAATTTAGVLRSGFTGAVNLAKAATTKLHAAVNMATLRMVGQRIAAVAAAVATKAMAVAQKILNVVLRANPLGLVITAVMLLVGALVAAYKKSETFRRIVDGAFRAVKTAAGALWGAVKSVFGAMGRFMTNTLPKAFRGGVDAIKRVWDTLKSVAAKPVNFVINTVYNNGIRRLLNAITGFLPGDFLQLPKISPVSWATGGWTGPGGKYQPAGIVHADEFVINKSSRRKIERDMPGLLSSLNGYASGGRVGRSSGSGSMGILEALRVGAKLLTSLPRTVLSMSEHFGAFGKIIGAGVKHVFGQVWDRVKGWLNPFDGGGGSAAAPSTAKGPVADIVRRVAAGYGWGSGAQWDALSTLISHESGWRPGAQNPTSTAYGLFQFLDSTWRGVGGSKTADPHLQAVYGLRYIRSRYGSPAGAWDFWSKHRWYDSGGVLPSGVSTVVNGTGKPEAVLTNKQWGLLTAVADQRSTTSRRVELVVEGRRFPAYVREVATGVSRAEQDYARKTDRLTRR